MVEVADGLKNPYRFVAHPNNPDKVFISEQLGQVIIFDKWNRLERPFLDLTNVVKQPTRGSKENGLLGICFDLDYINNRKVYISYTVENPGFNSKTVVSRFLHQVGNPDEVDMDTETVIIEINLPGFIHRSGEVMPFWGVFPNIFCYNIILHQSFVVYHILLVLNHTKSD